MSQLWPPDEDEQRVRTYDEHGEPHDDVLRTESGKVITEQDIDRLAEEALITSPVSPLRRAADRYRRTSRQWPIA